MATEYPGDQAAALLDTVRQLVVDFGAAHHRLMAAIADMPDDVEREAAIERQQQRFERLRAAGAIGLVPSAHVPAHIAFYPNSPMKA